MYQQGQKVKYLPENKIYDFGYYTMNRNTAVIYEEGECNMQDSISVDILDLAPVLVEPSEIERLKKDVENLKKEVEQLKRSLYNSVM